MSPPTSDHVSMSQFLCTMSSDAGSLAAEMGEQGTCVLLGLGRYGHRSWESGGRVWADCRFLFGREAPSIVTSRSVPSGDSSPEAGGRGVLLKARKPQETYPKSCLLKH